MSVRAAAAIAWYFIVYYTLSVEVPGDRSTAGTGRGAAAGGAREYSVYRSKVPVAFEHKVLVLEGTSSKLEISRGERALGERASGCASALRQYKNE